MEKTNRPSATNFWNEFLNSPTGKLTTCKAQPEAWGFGDGTEMADELGALVAAGIKTATASLMWEYESEGNPLPKPGDLSIILDGSGSPLCLIETVAVEVRPFNQVDAQFAYDEGEGDRTPEFWRDAHWRFFTRTCREIGREPVQDMPVVCERFKLIYLPA